MAAERDDGQSGGSSAGSVLAAGLFGLAVGVVAGLLLAPSAGKSTRREFKARLDDLKMRAQDLQDKVGEKIEEVKQHAATHYRQAAESARSEEAAPDGDGSSGQS